MPLEKLDESAMENSSGQSQRSSAEPLAERPISANPKAPPLHGGRRKSSKLGFPSVRDSRTSKSPPSIISDLPATIKPVRPTISSSLDEKFSIFENRFEHPISGHNNRINGQLLFPQAYKYLCHIAEARQWMKDIICRDLPPILEFEDALRDGVMLVELVQKLRPKRPYGIFRHPKLQFRHSENIAHFLRFLAEVELPERFRFDLVDLYERKNIPKVIYCIHALSYQLCIKENLNPFIPNLFGSPSFENDDLEWMQRHLDGAGRKMPIFSELSAYFLQTLKQVAALAQPEENMKIKFTENGAELIDLQAQVRGAITRIRLGDIMQSLWKIEQDIVELQSLVRGKWAREVCQYRVNIHGLVVKLQSAARGCIIRQKTRARETWWEGEEQKVIVLQRFIRKRKCAIKAESRERAFQDELTFMDHDIPSHETKKLAGSFAMYLDSIFISISLYLSNSRIGLLKRWSRYWEPPLDEGKIRIRWNCQCNRHLWDDFVQLRPGSADDLRKSLHHRDAVLANRPQGSFVNDEGRGAHGDVPVTNLSSEGDLGLSSMVAMTSPANIESSQSGEGGLLGGITSGKQPPLDLYNPKKEFLLLCFKKKNDTLRLSQLDIGGIANDFQLFNMLKAFERHPRDRVVILSAPDILPQRVNPSACHKDHVSPKCDTTYDIHPTPPDLDPYLGRNGLAHLLEYPHEAEEEGNNLPAQTVWLRRIPKKEKTKLVTCPPYQYGLGWGIEFEEAWCLNQLVKLTTTVLMLAAIIFLVCWWRFHGDLQGATGMAGFLISCSAALIALASALAID